MDGRREPRFPVQGPVKLTLASNPERELQGLLLDVSATGLRLSSSESFPVGSMISVETEEQFTLAEVRNSEPRGSKFTIGVERVYVLQKFDLPEEQSTAGRVRWLVEEYQNRINAGSDAQEQPVASPTLKEPVPGTPKPLPDASQFTTREQLLETAVQWVAERWEQLPAGPLSGRSARGEILERLASCWSERQRLESLGAASLTFQPASFTPLERVEPKRFQFPDIREMAARISLGRWRVPIGLTLTVLVGWAVAETFWGNQAGAWASHLSGQLAALFSSKPAAPAAPSPVPSGPSRVRIKALEPTWVMASSDGKRIFNKKLSKNAVREIEFSGKAVVRVANAAGVEISLDGKPIGRIGGRGQARMIELTAAGFRQVPLQ